MAARTPAKKAPAKSRRKAAPEPEVEDDDLDVEADEDEDETPAPKKKAAAKKAPAKAAPKKETLGSAWLKEHVADTLGTDVESTKLRIVLRKLIKDGAIESPKDGRYVFTGPRDPNVKAVVAALREEAKAGPSKKGRKPKAAKVAEEAEDDDAEVEDLDLDDDDE